MLLLKCLVLSDGAQETKHPTTKTVGFSPKSYATKGSPHKPHPEPKLGCDHPELDNTVELIASVCGECLTEDQKYTVGPVYVSCMVVLFCVAAYF